MTNKENMLLFVVKHLNPNLYKTEDQPYSDTSLNGECSLDKLANRTNDQNRKE